MISFLKNLFKKEGVKKAESKTKTRSPINKLPDEIFRNIFSNFFTVFEIYGILSLVCRRYKFICNHSFVIISKLRENTHGNKLNSIIKSEVKLKMLKKIVKQKVNLTKNVNPMIKEKWMDPEKLLLRMTKFCDLVVTKFDSMDLLFDFNSFFRIFDKFYEKFSTLYEEFTTVEALIYFVRHSKQLDKKKKLDLINDALQFNNFNRITTCFKSLVQFIKLISDISEENGKKASNTLCSVLFNVRTNNFVEKFLVVKKTTFKKSVKNFVHIFQYFHQNASCFGSEKQSKIMREYYNFVEIPDTFRDLKDHQQSFRNLLKHECLVLSSTLECFDFFLFKLASRLLVSKKKVEKKYEESLKSKMIVKYKAPSEEIAYEFVQFFSRVKNRDLSLNFLLKFFKGRDEEGTKYLEILFDHPSAFILVMTELNKVSPSNLKEKLIFVLREYFKTNVKKMLFNLNYSLQFLNLFHHGDNELHHFLVEYVMVNFQKYIVLSTDQFLKLFEYFLFANDEQRMQRMSELLFSCSSKGTRYFSSIEVNRILNTIEKMKEKKEKEKKQMEEFVKNKSVDVTVENKDTAFTIDGTNEEFDLNSSDDGGVDDFDDDGGVEDFGEDGVDFDDDGVDDFDKSD